MSLLEIQIAFRFGPTPLSPWAHTANHTWQDTDRPPNRPGLAPRVLQLFVSFKKRFATGADVKQAVTTWQQFLVRRSTRRSAVMGDKLRCRRWTRWSLVCTICYTCAISCRRCLLACFVSTTNFPVPLPHGSVRIMSEYTNITSHRGTFVGVGAACRVAEQVLRSAGPRCGN